MYKDIDIEFWSGHSHGRSWVFGIVDRHHIWRLMVIFGAVESMTLFYQVRSISSHVTPQVQFPVPTLNKSFLLSSHEAGDGFSEVYVVRPSGAEVWKNTPKLLWMKVNSRSWSAGTVARLNHARSSSRESLRMHPRDEDRRLPCLLCCRRTSCAELYVYSWMEES